MKSRPLSYYCTVAMGTAAMFVLGGLASTTFTDNFNNNVIGPVWDNGSIGGVNVSETNGRLQFSANGSTGALSAAGLAIEPWGANVNRDFQVEINSVINLSNVNGGKRVFLGFGFANEADAAIWPNDGAVLCAGVVQDQFGMAVGWVLLNNGVVVDSDTFPVTSTSGKITVEFDKSDDELKISRNGHTVTYTGFFTDFGQDNPTGPLVITLGCVTLSGNIAFSGNKVRLDNFEFNGFKRQR